ncbi:MAG TPA: tetratricopeptide repeat protein [Aliidongia sp.]|nr:tetratricopeptide repeat protein [Aliidongia sp.]
MTGSTKLAFQEAVAQHRAGRLDRAETGYRRVVEAEPDHAEGHHLLGMVLVRTGRAEAALDCFDRAIALVPQQAGFRVDRGSALGNLGRLDEAIENFRQAIELDPKSSEAHGNLAFALGAQGRLEEAAERYRHLLGRDPKNGRAHYGLGCALLGLGRLETAVPCFREAIRLNPNAPEIHNNLGMTLFRLGRLPDAAQAWQNALRLQPDFYEARLNFGTALGRLGRPDLALDQFKAAIRLRPDRVDPHRGQGDALINLGRMDEAAASYRAALDLRPEDAVLHNNLGTILASLDRRDEAVESYETALRLDPDNLGTRANLAVTRLRVIYPDAAEIERSRAAYAADLTALLAAAEAQIAEGKRPAPEATGDVPPFFLAYQGRNDRELQALYGRFVGAVVAAARPDWTEAPAIEPSGAKIRVGILSSSFWDHAVWRIVIKGWLAGLDRERFELYGYHVGAVADAETERAAGLCHRFTGGRRPLDAWAETVRADKLNVLIFPDIGMDALTIRLAALRLAPVQAASWAHPETTGLATIDAFLTSDLMEPADGEAAYTEKLVRLPNLASCYEPPPLAPAEVTRAAHGIPEDAVLYWCCQSLFKYLPAQDRLFAEIAKRVPNAHFAFISFQRGPAMTELFRDRLAQAFAAEGLDAAKHCTFLPRLSAAEFAGFTRLADIFLDSIGWTGGNTTLEALGAGLPVVTQAGALMRGRHSAGILTMLGLPELIAQDETGYVELAVRLGTDEAARRDLAGRITTGRDRLYGDKQAIAGLAAWIEEAVKPMGSKG